MLASIAAPFHHSASVRNVQFFVGHITRSSGYNCRSVKYFRIPWLSLRSPKSMDGRDLFFAPAQSA
jgi:hypothetical protein